MTTPTYDITIIEGESYSLTLTLTENGVPVPLAGYSFISKIKASYADNEPTLATFTATIDPGVPGTVTLSLDHTITNGLLSSTTPLRAQATTGVWDVFYITPTGAHRYFLGGRVNFIQTVTKGGA